MFLKLRGIALSILFGLSATVAQAVTIAPTFIDPLAPGQSTQSNAIASGFEDYGLTQLGFTVSGDLFADASITVNPFTVSPGGIPSNSIGLSYSLNAGAEIPLTIIQNGPTGSSGFTDLFMMAGDSLTFFVKGVAGPGGNTVSFNVDTRVPAAVPVLPAGAFLLTGVALLGAARRRKS